MVHPSDTGHTNASYLLLLTSNPLPFLSNFAFISNINFSSQNDIVMIIRFSQNVHQQLRYTDEN